MHFEEFSGAEFERLVFAYALRAGWPEAEWVGQTGGDKGRDVQCERQGKMATFLCANYGTLTLAKVTSDLKRVAGSEPKPDEVFVVCGGRVSAGLREKIKAVAAKMGFESIVVWSGVELEERIRMTAPDLLARLCNGEKFPDAPQDLRKFAAASAVAKPEAEKFSAEAMRLLLAMSAVPDGGMVCGDTHSGFGISVGNKEFLADTMDQRVRAKWKRAIRDLVEREQIEENGPSGECFVLTHAGYETADTLKDTPANTQQGAAPAGEFRPAAMDNVAQFFRAAGGLIPDGPFGEGPVVVEIPASPALYLRVWPAQPVEALRSELATKQLAMRGNLLPMGLELGGRDWSRNEFGAIVYAGGHDGKLRNFTELFRTGEICGVDLRVVQRLPRTTVKDDVARRVLMIYRVELSCALALENFVTFARESLRYSGPLKIAAGLHGIKGCELSTGMRIVGSTLREEQTWNGELSGARIDPAEFLRPFFEQLWESFGLERWDEAHNHLVQCLRP